MSWNTILQKYSAGRKIGEEASKNPNTKIAKITAGEPEASTLTPGPTLLGIGQRVELGQLGFAGNATPEAALQSLLAYRRDGDVDGAIGLMLLPPGVGG